MADYIPHIGYHIYFANFSTFLGHPSFSSVVWPLFHSLFPVSITSSYWPSLCPALVLLVTPWHLRRPNLVPLSSPPLVQHQDVTQALRICHLSDANRIYSKLMQVFIITITIILCFRTRIYLCDSYSCTGTS